MNKNNKRGNGVSMRKFCAMRNYMDAVENAQIMINDLAKLKCHLSLIFTTQIDCFKLEPVLVNTKNGFGVEVKKDGRHMGYGSGESLYIFQTEYVRDMFMKCLSDMINTIENIGCGGDISDFVGHE